MDKRKQMCNDFTEIQSSVKIMAFAFKNRISKLLFSLFVMIMLIILFVGRTADSHMTSIALIINLIVGAGLVYFFENYLPQKSMMDTDRKQRLFWNKYSEIIEGDMKENGISVISNKIVLNKETLVNPAVELLIAKSICKAYSEKDINVFEMNSPISIEDDRKPEDMIEWTNAIALLFVLLYA